ncbi:MAG: hypothetical protein QOH33_484, partial [Paraburkholderia sp.]|nr:hypothetical protein [Paraburkholderia sp.]
MAAPSLECVSACGLVITLPDTRMDAAINVELARVPKAVRAVSLPRTVDASAPCRDRCK